jgi:hypothetical protein
MRNEIRSALEAVANSWIPKVVLGIFVLCLAGTAALAIAQNSYSWRAQTPPDGIAYIDVGRLGMVVGTAGTASAFLVTLYVAERNYRRGREHIPHLTMQLRVNRVAVSGRYDAIVIALEAKNTGSGLCRVDEIQWAVHALSNYDDETAELMRQEFTERDDRGQETEFPWHEIATDVTSHSIAIEPGETEQMTHDVLVPHEIEAVIASAWVSNASRPKTTDGWYRRTPHAKQDG